MNESAFTQAKEAVEKSGLAIAESAYHASTFGSWYLVVKCTPQCRLTWDGKERWFVIEEATTQKVKNSYAWQDVWLCRAGNKQNLQLAINKLIEKALLNGNSGV
jgi:hypothetical protein